MKGWGLAKNEFAEFWLANAGSDSPIHNLTYTEYLLQKYPYKTY